MKPLPYCVLHRNGWCLVRDYERTKDRDSMATRCGFSFVVIPANLVQRLPDCPDCLRILKARSRLIGKKS